MKKLLLTAGTMFSLALSSMAQDVCLVDTFTNINYMSASDDIMNAYRNLNTYDEHNNLTLIITQQYDTTISEWKNNGKTIREYDANGNRITEHYHLWNADINDWENRYLRTYTFDANDNNIGSLELKWNEEENDWINYYKRTMDYDSNNNEIDRFTASWDTATSTFINSIHYDYTYDGNSNQLEFINRQWDVNLDDWLTLERRVYEYNANNDRTLYLHQTWDNDDELWINFRKDTWEFNANNQNITSQVEFWNASQNDWENNTKNSLEYDAEGNRIKNIEEKWNFAFQEWRENFITEYEFDANNNEIYYHIEKIVGGPVSDRQYTFTYNANNQLTERHGEKWNTQTDSWDNLDLLNYTFDSLGNELSRDTYSNWDETEGDYMSHNKVTNTYVCGSPTSILETSMEDYKIYPNPATDILVLESEQNAVFALHNITGKKISVINKTQFRQEVSLKKLSPGLYILRNLDTNESIKILKQ